MARLGGPSWGHSERSEESLLLVLCVHGREPSERFLVARRGGLVGMTPWPRPFDALAIAPARRFTHRGGLKAGAGATTTRTAPGRCLELTLFDAVLLSPSPRYAARLVGWLVWQGDAGDGVSCPGRDHKVSRPVSPAFARVADPSCPRRQELSYECLVCASGR